MEHSISGRILALACLLAPAAAAQQPAPEENVLFAALPVVEAATLHTQTLEEAPASVTVITEDDIRRYGYRTLGEALASARGFYVTYDRIYHYVGLRGFGLPGDYNTRFLLMLNGHYLTENIYSSAGFFGQDFGLDMDLVKRIEIVRGPSSALYGSNGIFTTINIVTRSPVDHPTARLTAELGSFGERKGLFSTALDLGHGANLLLSTSVFHNRGPSLYFPEFDARETNFGRAGRADAERGYHTFLNLVWRGWNLTALFNDREKQFPIPWGEGIFADPAQKSWDGRNYVEAAWKREVGRKGELRWRFYYDQYRWVGRTHIALEEGIEDNRDVGFGDWAGSQITYRRPTRGSGALTIGAEVNADIRALQRNYSVTPEPVEYLNVDVPDRGFGVFAQQEWDLARRWKAYLGLRLDDSSHHERFLSPRLALIHQRSPDTTLKFLYGRAFRNPSAMAQFYDDHGLSAVANPLVRAETAHTFEVAVERRLGKRLAAVASVYQYRLAGLIQGVRDEDGLLQYRNLAGSRAAGAEFELSGRPWRRFEVSGSLAVQDAIDTGARERLPNSPTALAKLRAGAPVLANKLFLSGALQLMSERRSLGGARLPSSALLDLTAGTERLHRNFDLQFGVRNAGDCRHYDPVALVHTVDRMASNGRTAYLKLIWHTAASDRNP